jgi:hypothetical protein
MTTFRVLVETLMPWPIDAPTHPPGTMLAVGWYGWKPPNQPPETKTTERMWQLTPELDEAIDFTSEDDAGSWMDSITQSASMDGSLVYRPFQIQRGSWPTTLDRANRQAAAEWGRGGGGDRGPRGPLIPR